ncbi:MAG: ABC transporter permease [Bacteroidota bacterium]
MFDIDKWQEIFNTIRKHKLRTFLTALGVFWGIFMLVFLMGSGKGLENGVMSMMGDHVSNSMYVWTQRTSKPYMGLPPGRRAQLTMNDIEAIKSRYDDKIKYVAPRLHLNVGEIVRKGKQGAFEVRGELPEIIHIDPVDVVDGRFLNKLDVDEKRKVITIGDRVKRVLFEDEEAVGQYLKIAGADYLVVGVFKSKRRGEDGDEDAQTIFMPLTTAQQVINRPNDIAYFVCSVHDNIKVSEVEDGVLALLRKRHKVAPDDRMGVRSNNLEEEFGEITGLFTGISLIVWVVGIGSLLAGVIGVGNIMLIVVKERTKEIGIRKAMGATPNSIISMVLLESVFITTIAGYLGLLVSTGIIVLMNVAVGEGGEFFANPEVNMNVGVGALIILIISGAITGLLPAIQASKVNPVVALKDE